MKQNNVLVVVAHPDDEILGIGGTIIKHILNGDKVSVIILGTGITSRDNIKDAENEIKKLINVATEISNEIGYDLYFESFEDNKFDKYPLLNIVKKIESKINTIKPNIIYTHNYSDLNIDHRLTFEATITAARPCNNVQVKEIYCFETVSSTEWQAPQLQTFKPHVFNKLPIHILHKKIECLKLYKSEMKRSLHPRSYSNILNVANKWGVVVKMSYCEVLEVIRIIKD